MRQKRSVSMATRGADHSKELRTYLEGVDAGGAAWQFVLAPINKRYFFTELAVLPPCREVAGADGYVGVEVGAGRGDNSDVVEAVGVGVGEGRVEHRHGRSRRAG